MQIKWDLSESAPRLRKVAPASPAGRHFTKRSMQMTRSSTKAPAFLFLLPRTGTDLVLRAHGDAHLRPHATWQEVSFRSSRSSMSMMTDSLDVVFQLRKSYTTTKRRLGVTEAFVSETIRSSCGNAACERGAFAPSLAVHKSSVAVESRSSEVHFTLDICDVPRPLPSSYSVVFLTDDPSAPEHEVVLQVEEEGLMSAVVEMRCGAAYRYKYRLYREGKPLDEEEDREVFPSRKRELVLENSILPGEWRVVFLIFHFPQHRTVIFFHCNVVYKTMHTWSEAVLK